MSENRKKNQIQNTNLENFDDEDLWEIQSKKEDYINKSLELEMTADLIENLPLELPINNQEVDSINENLALENITETKELEEKNIEILKQENINSIPENKEEKSIISSLELEEKIEPNIDNKSDTLITEITVLEQKKQELINQQETMISSVNLLIQEGLKELEEKKQNLELTIQKLERRKERIEQEMKSTFSGVSQDLSIRVQGFKDYLVGSLQDLAAAAEQLELSNTSSQSWETPSVSTPSQNNNPNPNFVENNFQGETRQIRSLINQYRTKPDYYGSPWQLRRTFEPIHAERVAEWFFTQGGRGALRSMGTRLQNILIASAIMSILYQLYGDRSRMLILTDTPERLGEWRRGLQDCLGISRSDFGPNRGVILFETPESLIQKGDRIVEEKDLPFIIMDQSDDKVSLSLLKFPLWLAFAADQTNKSSNYYY
ncbi:MAG: DUF3086 domain-containing protein [Cyanobacteria bacterium]|nr:DUF3086 domain-containing protein [Cyanobacteria bacterium CG_2015-16_32_12]NCO77669.1 DUF3086 domain-containing protein [Cyanobacteria bacterium CG_2015-22_32_23]NCQ05149.1 DUF3086 domain-containing protein [Cyanobacteria bacterium CG_2015-09_32_10]NCS85914.1 DUF3086 domain-containing protein [Cyanobacteria bacterium CG_2015-02_32_10]